MNFWLQAALHTLLPMYSTNVLLHVKDLGIRSRVAASRDQKGQRLNVCAHAQREDDRAGVNRTGWYGADCGGETRWSQGR